METCSRGPVFTVVTHGTGLGLAGPFLLWCSSRTMIKSIRSKKLKIKIKINKRKAII